MAEFAYVGLTLQVLRQRRGLSVQRMIERLGKQGYGITATIYAQIENGANLPQDPRSFLKALTVCLNLTELELEVLVNLCALAMLTQELGEDLARESLRQPISMQTSA